MSRYTEAIQKFNPHHDPKTGRFTSKNGGGTKTSPITINKEIGEVLKSYTAGKYGNICNYSQYLADPKNVKHGKDFFEKHYLPDISEQEKKNTNELIKAIDSQPIDSTDLVRIEGKYRDFEVGEELNWGIKSTSRNADFGEKVHNGLDEGLDIKNDLVEYIIKGNKKHLDIAAYSEFDQQESLVKGKFKVTAVEKIEYKEPKIQTWDEVADAGGYERFTSKKGNPMVRDLGTGQTFTENNMKNKKYINGKILTDVDEWDLEVKRKSFFARTKITLEQIL